MILMIYGIKVVGEVGSVVDVVVCFNELKLDVLMLDICFGEVLIGLDVVVELLKIMLVVKIVFMSQFNNDLIIKCCYQIGGKVFVMKDCELNDLVMVIKQVKVGQFYFLLKVVECLVNLLVLGDQLFDMVLYEWEMQIFKFMVQGLMIVEIVEVLNLLVKMISNMSQIIKEKLDVYCLVEIICFVIWYGLIEV